MSDQEIEIRFKATREGTAGADSIEELDEVAARVEELRHESQELVETNKELDRTSEEAGDALGDLVSLERAQAAASLAEQAQQLAAGIRSMATELEGLSPESAEKLDNVGFALETAANAAEAAAVGYAVGGPKLALAMATVEVAAAPLVKSFRDMSTELKLADQATRNAEKAERDYQNLLGQRKLVAEQAALAGLFSRERDALDGVAAALERQISLLKVKRQVDQQIQDAGFNVASRSGADPNAVANNRREAALEARAVELQDQLDDERRRAQIVIQRESQAISEAKFVNDPYVSSSQKQVDEANAREQAAIEAANIARENLAALEAEVALRVQALAAKSADVYSEGIEDVGEGLTQQAEDALAAFREIGSEALSKNAEQFSNELSGLLGDLTPDDQQATQIVQAIERLRTTQEARDAAIFERLTQAIDSGLESTQLIEGLKNKQEAFEERLSSLK